MVLMLRALVELEDSEAAAARRAVERGLLRRSALAWRGRTAEACFARRCAALRQYAKWLIHYAVQLWRAGIEQSKLDRDFELHRERLQQKVSGWLTEMDAARATAA